MNLADLAASPATIQVAGETLKLAPLSIGDLADFTRWVEDETLRRARERLNVYKSHDALDAAERKSVLDAAYKSVDNGTAEAKLLSEFEGMVTIMWYSLRQHQPSLTVAQVRGMFDPLSIEIAKGRLFRISGLEDDELPNGEATAPTPEAVAGENSSAPLPATAD